MPRDGSGNYTLPAGNPVATGTLIQTTWANLTMNDVAAQLNNVITRDGVVGPAQPFKLVDGLVGAPGLAFNSEPGLGWLRPGTNQISIAAVNTIVEEGGYNAAADTYKYFYPRAEGATSIGLGRSPHGAINTSFLRLRHSAAETRFDSLAAGTGLMTPFVFQATLHRFNSTDANVYSQFSRPAGDSARLTINKHTGVSSVADILATRNGVARWSISLGDGVAESGSLNSGSNFLLSRYSDAGALIDSPIDIDRSGGVVLFRTGFLNVVNPVTPFASAFSANTGAPGSVTPLTRINGNFIYTAAGFTGAVGTGKAQFLGDLEFTNIASPGRPYLAPTHGISWNTFYLEGTNRTGILFDTTVTPGFGFTILSKVFHDPGVSARFRVTLASQSFDMLSTGTGSSIGGWIATSDARLKTNKAPIADALQKIDQLGGWTFDREDMADLDKIVPRKAGYMAQDVQKVLPEAVVVADDEMGTLSVDHNAVIGLLIEGVKELHARIYQLES
jgi:hypothetical protein